MSSTDVRRALLRMQTDDDFLDQVRTAPEEAFHDYELSEAERSALIRRDNALRAYVMGDAIDESVTITITITGMHDWFNVTDLRPMDQLSDDVRSRVRDQAERVLGASGGERVDLLLTLLQLFDGRAK